jgi:hypothetical protein
VVQEYAMSYYAGLSFIVMLGAVLRINAGKDILLFALIGEGVAIFLGNVLSTAAMKRKIAEVLFVSESFSLISVHDLVYKSPPLSFPLKFANPVRMGDTIQVHYLDQVLTLKKEDFDDFDLIWNWFLAAPPA